MSNYKCEDCGAAEYLEAEEGSEDMKNFECEDCGAAEYSEVVEGALVKQCPYCGSDRGMKHAMLLNRVNIRKYGGGDNPMSTTYAQVKHRPRSGNI